MPSNAELMQKADMTVADLAANGGLLNPEQSDTFIRKLIEAPTLLNVARTVTMSAPSRKIEKIGFGTRILRPGVSGTPLDPADRSAATTELVQLDTKEVIAEVNLPYDVIEDNIERGNIGNASDGSDTGGGIADTIMALIAERVAADLEELAIQGDTGSADAYLALLDGFLVQATTNVVDNQNQVISRDMFKQGIKTIQAKYLRNRGSMRHMVSVNNETEYRDQIANRQTQVGDNALQGTVPVFSQGVPLRSAELMPDTNGITTNPLNMIFGIQRNIHVETDKDIRSRVYIIVVTARVDFKYEEEEAVIKYENIAAN